MSVFSTVYPQSYPSRKSISQDPSTDGTLASRRATKQRPLDEAAAVLNRSVPQATRKSKTHDYLAARELHTSSGAICSSRRSLSSSSQAPSPSNSASFEARRSKLALTRATSCSDMAPAASKGACPTVGKAENVRSRYQGGSRCEQAQSASGLKTSTSHLHLWGKLRPGGVVGAAAFVAGAQDVSQGARHTSTCLGVVKIVHGGKRGWMGSCSVRKPKNSRDELNAYALHHI